MKRIRNWKIVDTNRGCDNAFIILKDQVYHGDNTNLACRIGPFAIKHAKTGKFFDKFDNDIYITPKDCSSDWMILVPDDDKEQKNEKIRKLVKDSNCSGLTYDKIDNMSTHEIFRHIITHINEEQEYRWLLKFYENQIFKTK